MKLSKLILSLVILLSLSACGDGITYIDGHEIFSVYSEVGEKCFNEIYKKAKWGVEVSGNGNFFADNLTIAIEKEGNCKCNNYSFYLGGDSIFIYNAFNAAQRTDFFCIKNNITNKYTVLIENNLSAVRDFLAHTRGKTTCERYEQVAKTMELLD